MAPTASRHSSGIPLPEAGKQPVAFNSSDSALEVSMAACQNHGPFLAA